MGSDSNALKKIRKSHHSEATELELKIAKHLHDLEHGTNANESVSKNLKAALAGFTFNSAKELEVSSTKTAVIVFYPLRFIRKIRKVQRNLVHELQKKVPNVMFVCQRKIETNQGKTSNKPIQRSRTMKAVHEATLEDIVYPSEICGRRTRQLLDGSKNLKVFINASEKDIVNPKIDMFEAAYNKLTGNNVSFGFMSNSQLQQIVA